MARPLLRALRSMGATGVPAELLALTYPDELIELAASELRRQGHVLQRVASEASGSAWCLHPAPGREEAADRVLRYLIGVGQSGALRSEIAEHCAVPDVVAVVAELNKRGIAAGWGISSSIASCRRVPVQGRGEACRRGHRECRYRYWREDTCRPAVRGLT